MVALLRISLTDVAPEFDGSEYAALEEGRTAPWVRICYAQALEYFARGFMVTRLPGQNPLLIEDGTLYLPPRFTKEKGKRIGRVIAIEPEEGF